MSNLYNQNSEYDKGVNTFSKEGRIYQIDYAIKAVEVPPLGSYNLARDHMCWYCMCRRDCASCRKEGKIEPDD